MYKKRPFYRQKNSMDCGITCLRMICKYYGKRIAASTLLNIVEVENVGISMAGIKKTGESIGLDVQGFRLTELDQLKLLSKDLPFIVHWNRKHFVTVYSLGKRSIVIGDPAKGILRVSYKEFYKKAFKTDRGSAQAPAANILTLEPTEAFEKIQDDKSQRLPKIDFIKKHLRDKKFYFVVIFLGLLALMSIQFVLPFLTKNVVDVGIKNGDLDMIKYLLMGQFFLIISKAIFEASRNYIIQHLSVRINYSLLANFIEKLFKLTVPFFEKRKIGDLLQRIKDHQRVEFFLTKSLLNVSISILTVMVFSTVLFIFNKIFFFLFLGATVLYVSWIMIFLPTRKKIDWERFEVGSRNQTILVQAISGIQDLKIYGAFPYLLSKWKSNQKDYIKNAFKTLKITQIQETGASYIYQLSQIVILFFSARLIIMNQLTIGSMLSIQFIIGQLISPVQQLLMSVIFGVEAKLSFDRIFDLWDAPEENHQDNKIEDFESKIAFKNVRFKHGGHQSSFILNDVNIEIRKGETIAIVGSSGSGKTTILKLLLGYYSDYNGSISIDNRELNSLNIESWRKKCGVVLQDNYIFSDTLAKNIALSEKFDMNKIREAVRIADLDQYVKTLPLKYNTVIGDDGMGLSQGQKQRILIARAVYKQPEILLLDEATNALDSETETNIINNLNGHASKKTVVLIAHRLSTVKHANKIYVFKDGMIGESGSHDELINSGGIYYNLVQRQLNQSTYAISQ
ncbi:peptidase domain-containing ABC transporter [Galbibacter pacificus]|nr:peptidase domain-containing ABC transporter [Galbibacter pacificus]